MTELDQVWSQMLGEAAGRASDAGRRDVADYLRLKAANDAVREAGVGWLIDSFVEIAASSLAEHKNLAITRDEPHNFARGSSNMAGTRLDIRQGVRCLTVEAGWARTPSDGIMQNGALALARISHFGMSKNGAEFRLVHSAVKPQWLDQEGAVLYTGELQRHFNVFLGL